MLTLIGAVDSQMGIGKNNEIPWHNSEDLQFFKQETIGGAVIMGRKTWESLGKNALPNRTNIVVSRTLHEDFSTDLGNVIYAPDTIAAVNFAKWYSARIYAIGGHNIYKCLMPVANRIVLSRIDGAYNCDTQFPTINEKDWYKHEYHIGDLHIHEYIRKDQNVYY